MEHKGTKILETARLLLRPFRAEDGDAMFRNWTHDPEVTRFAPTSRIRYSITARSASEVRP